MASPLVTLILGGARSGKSRAGEALITANPAPWIYIATARALDAEMRERIAAHRVRRGAGWHTIEAPEDLAAALRDVPAEAPILVDCLTLWLSNLLLAGLDEGGLEAAVVDLERALEHRVAPVVLITNEVGLGIVPDHPLGRRFRDAAGRLHQRLAVRADRVLFMVAGLALTMKEKT